MKFFSDGPDIPLELLEARDKGDVVFLCGAGVSVPSGMPTFFQLAKKIATELGAQNAPLLKALYDEPADTSVPLDQIFGFLQKEYGVGKIERLVTRLLRTPKKAHTQNHKTILRLSSDAQGVPRLVTTNFDLLFESAGSRIKCFVPPYLPDLNYSGALEGLVYLHGRLDGSQAADKKLRGLVLGIGDLGRAYLADGWATRFMNQLISRYTVVLLGYSANDVPIRYLLEGLNARGSKPKLFAFAEGEPGETKERWWDRGVMAIPYRAEDSKHSALWNTLSAWAERAESADKWHEKTLDLARRGPRSLAPHERGQVAAMALTLGGAIAIADAKPEIPAEWLCVFDSTIRYGRVQGGWPKDEEDFDPLETYRLDSDPPRSQNQNQNANQAIGVNVLAPLGHDERVPNYTRLAGQIAHRAEPLSARLNHLGRWIATNVADPISVWWAAHHHQLHPNLQNLIEWNLRNNKGVPPVVRQGWMLYLEASQHDPQRDHRDLYDLLDVIKHDGWSETTMRRVRRTLEPYLSVEAPIFYPRPPSADDGMSISRLMRADVKFIKSGEKIDCPDHLLPWLVASVRIALLHAASIKRDLEIDKFSRTPSLHHEDKPGHLHLDDDDAFFLWFAELFKRLTEIDADSARREIMQWPIDDECYFSKLSIWGWMFASVATAQGAIEGLLKLSDESFWRERHQRELMWTIRARWPDFSKEQRSAIEERILAGPPSYPTEENEEHLVRKARASAVRLGWMLLNGLELNKATTDALPSLRSVDSEWRESWVRGADLSFDSRGGTVHTDTDASALMDAPLDEVVSRIAAIERRPAGGFVERNPFLGFYKARPVRALAVLTREARKGNFPVQLWRTLLTDDMPVKLRFRWTVARRIAQLPPNVIVDLSRSACRWLQGVMPEFFERRAEEALSTWDSVFTALTFAGPNATTSGMGDMSIGGVQQKLSRRTFTHAINGPIGELTEALILTLSKAKPTNRTGVPQRFKDRFMAAMQSPGEGADHATSIIFWNLKWLFYLDPTWTKSHLIPFFKHSHALSEPAWSGFLFDNRVPHIKLFELLKQDYLEAFEVSKNWKWEDEASARLSQFLVVATVGTGKRVLSNAEARGALQSCNDDMRTASLRQLSSMIASADDWRSHGKPFVEEIWPQEIRFQTSSTSGVLADIATKCGDDFPNVVQRVNSLLQPVEHLDSLIHELVDEGEGAVPLATRFPREAVVFIERLTPDIPRYVPYNLRELLRKTADHLASLRQMTEWRRLNDLISKA